LLIGDSALGDDTGWLCAPEPSPTISVALPFGNDCAVAAAGNCVIAPDVHSNPLLPTNLGSADDPAMLTNG
jgi:hypothetical protein